MNVWFAHKRGVAIALVLAFFGARASARAASALLRGASPFVGDG